MPGHDDDGQRRPALRERLLKLDPVHARHPHIGDDAAVIGRCEGGEERDRGVVASDIVPGGLQKDCQRVANGLVVIYAEDGGFSHGGTPCSDPSGRSAIGSASGWERVCEYVYISVVAV